MTVREKLEDNPPDDDNSIIRHGSMENIRDYEMIVELIGISVIERVQYIFKGCMEAYFKNTVEPRFFSMDDRLFELDRQDEPDYPKGKFIWEAGANTEGWKLEENTKDLTNLENMYKIKFYKFTIYTNAYTLSLVFHDIQINIIKHIDR